MIAGPLFIYHGFNLLPWPVHGEVGALSIAIGFFVLIFGFSLWQDREVRDPPADAHPGCGRDEAAPERTERRGQTIRGQYMQVQARLTRDTMEKEVPWDKVWHIRIPEGTYHKRIVIGPVFLFPKKNRTPPC